MTEPEKNAYILIRRKLVSSRAELARKLGISRPTASTVCESLLQQNLIKECGKGKSTGGATPTLLAANNTCPGIIGIDFGYTDKMSAVLLDGAGNITAQQETTFSPSDRKSITEQASFLIGELRKKTAVNGVALALSAIIDEKTHKVQRSINPLFCDESLFTQLRDLVQLPVFIANRSRAAAVSEAFGGAADKEENFALISLGRSVGAAFWCNGKLFCGAGSAAGEIRNLHLADGERLEDALAKDKIRSLEDLLEKCSDALRQLIDIMDFKLLVLSGRFADFGREFAPLLEKKLDCDVKIRLAEFGRYSAARGSAFLMAEELIGCVLNND